MIKTKDFIRTLEVKNLCHQISDVNFMLLIYITSSSSNNYANRAHFLRSLCNHICYMNLGMGVRRGSMPKYIRVCLSPKVFYASAIPSAPYHLPVPCLIDSSIKQQDEVKGPSNFATFISLIFNYL